MPEHDLREAQSLEKDRAALAVAREAEQRLDEVDRTIAVRLQELRGSLADPDWRG